MWNSKLLFLDSDKTMQGKDCAQSRIRLPSDVDARSQQTRPPISPPVQIPSRPPTHVQGTSFGRRWYQGQTALPSEQQVPSSPSPSVVMETIPSFYGQGLSRLDSSALPRQEINTPYSVYTSPVWSTRQSPLPSASMGAESTQPETRWRQMPRLRQNRPEGLFSFETQRNRRDIPNVMPNQPEMVCNFCKTNGEMKTVYESHKLIERGRIICPVLRRYVCPLCGATGDDAHTMSYCPLGSGAPSVASVRTPRKSCGCKRVCRHGDQRHH